MLSYLHAVYDNNTFPTLREVFGRQDAAAYIKVKFNHVHHICYMLLQAAITHCLFFNVEDRSRGALRGACHALQGLVTSHYR